MLSAEMKNTMKYYEHEVQCIQECIQVYSSKDESLFNCGALALLKEHLQELQVYITQCTSLTKSCTSDSEDEDHFSDDDD